MSRIRIVIKYLMAYQTQLLSKPVVQKLTAKVVDKRSVLVNYRYYSLIV